MQPRPTLTFGDDRSPAADVCWLWINSHTWPGWRLEDLLVVGFAQLREISPKHPSHRDREAHGFTSHSVSRRERDVYCG